MVGMLVGMRGLLLRMVGRLAKVFRMLIGVVGAEKLNMRVFVLAIFFVTLSSPMIDRS